MVYRNLLVVHLHTRVEVLLNYIIDIELELLVIVLENALNYSLTYFFILALLIDELGTLHEMPDDGFEVAPDYRLGRGLG